MNVTLSFLLLPLIAAPLFAQRPDLIRNSQNPSPMTESTRAHDRVEEKTYEGFRSNVAIGGSTRSEVFIPRRFLDASSFDLLIHFHGSAFVVQYAATQCPDPLIVVTMNFGSGSSRYGDAFLDTTAFPGLIDSVRLKLKLLKGVRSINRIYLSGFSAGYGAIRGILSSESNYAMVAGVLLLDGIHAGYVPDRTVLAQGGAVEARDLAVFLRLARDASREQSTKKFLITHSEIFPGTFVSTTEATDYLIGQLGLARTPLLDWGPGGMQQLSVTKSGHFEVLGFAGNSAPDHVDHLHGLFRFLKVFFAL